MSQKIIAVFERLDELLKMMGQELYKENPSIERLREIYDLIGMNAEVGHEEEE